MRSPTTSTKSGFWHAQVDIAVARDSSLTPVQKAVYLVVCTHVDVKSRTAVLSVAAIAEETNCGKRTVQEAIKALVARGALQREERFTERRQIACLYRAIGHEAPCYGQKQPQGVSTPQADADSAEDAGICTHGDVEFCAPEGAGAAHKQEPRVNENQKNNPTPLTPQRAEGEETLEIQKADHDTAEQEKNPDTALAQAILDAYHRILPELEAVPEITPFFTREIEARIREDPARIDLAWWERYFRSIRDYPCAMGKSSSDWRANFKWLIGARGMGKVLDGKFKPASSTKGGSESGWERQKQFTNEEGEVDARALLRQG